MENLNTNELNEINGGGAGKAIMWAGALIVSSVATAGCAISIPVTGWVVAGGTAASALSAKESWSNMKEEISTIGQ